MENLGGQRLIRGKRATHRGSDISVLQAQPVVAVQGSGLVRKSRLMQGLVKKIAGAIAGENAACAIRSMRGGSQPKDEQLGVGIAEAGHASAPIGPLAESAPLLLRHLFAVFHQARTLAACANFFTYDFQRGFRVQRFLFSASASTTAWFCRSSFLP